MWPPTALGGSFAPAVHSLSVAPASDAGAAEQGRLSKRPRTDEAGAATGPRKRGRPRKHALAHGSGVRAYEGGNGGREVLTGYVSPSPKGECVPRGCLPMGSECGLRVQRRCPLAALSSRRVSPASAVRQQSCGLRSRETGCGKARIRSLARPVCGVVQGPCELLSLS